MFYIDVAKSFIRQVHVWTLESLAVRLERELQMTRTNVELTTSSFPADDNLRILSSLLVSHVVGCFELIQKETSKQGWAVVQGQGDRRRPQNLGKYTMTKDVRPAFG